MTETITKIFYPIFSPIFSPINTFLCSFFQPYALIVTLLFFVSAMIWVCFILKNDYVNLDRPNKHFWSDLRLWTVLSMIPHIIVYLYFYKT